MRKTKANYWTIPTYYQFHRGKIIRNNIEYRGTFFKPSNKLTTDQKEDLQAQHDNIEFFISQCQKDCCMKLTPLKKWGLKGIIY